MSDDPNNRGQADRSRIATGEDYEVRYFVDTMKKQFPGKSSDEIKGALTKARKATGAQSREVLTAKVVQILSLLTLSFLICVGTPAKAADPADPAPVVSLSAEIIINVSSGGLTETSRHPSSPADMETKLKTIATVFDDPVVVLRADYKTSHVQISEMIRACEAAGLHHVKVETGGPVALLR